MANASASKSELVFLPPCLIHIRSIVRTRQAFQTPWKDARSSPCLRLYPPPSVRVAGPSGRRGGRCLFRDTFVADWRVAAARFLQRNKSRPDAEIRSDRPLGDSWPRMKRNTAGFRSL